MAGAISAARDMAIEGCVPPFFSPMRNNRLSVTLLVKRHEVLFAVFPWRIARCASHVTG